MKTLLVAITLLVPSLSFAASPCKDGKCEVPQSRTIKRCGPFGCAEVKIDRGCKDCPCLKKQVKIRSCTPRLYRLFHPVTW